MAPASPETIVDFSATPFYFAGALEGELDLPVWVIVSAYGGTTITQWLAQNKTARATVPTSVMKAAVVLFITVRCPPVPVYPFGVLFGIREKAASGSVGNMPGYR